MKKVMFVSVIVASTLCAFSAGAADEALVRKFLAKSHFRDEAKRQMQSSKRLASADTGNVLAKIDYTNIEEAYMKALAGGLSNDDVLALIKAYEIPGFQDAVRKQAMAAPALINATVSEVKRATADAKRAKP